MPNVFRIPPSALWAWGGILLVPILPFLPIPRESPYLIWAMLLPQFVFIAAAVAATVASPRKGLLRKWLLMPPRHPFSFWKALGFGFLGLFLVMATNAFQMFIFKLFNIPYPQSTDHLIFSMDDPLIPWMIGISAVLIAPLVEELIFRRFAFDGFAVLFKREKFSAFARFLFPGILVSLLFTLMHFDPIKIFPLLALSLFLQYLRYHYRSLVPCIAVHFVNNAVSAAALLIARAMNLI